MEGIIEVGSAQYKVKNEQIIYIPAKNKYKKGDSVVFDKILYLVENGNLILGKPYVKDAKVEGIVEDIVKGSKLQWIKYGKSSFMKKKGYRQIFAKIKITNIKK
jgi:large subunit ribosomal protein L21